MSEDDRDFDEFLRRVLREEAAAVQPADDGLERIRARLTRPRPVPVAWVMAVFSGAWRRVRGGAQSALAWLQTLPGAAHLARPRPPGGGRAGKWRSPVVLAACAAVAVTAGVLALTPLPQQAVSRTAALFRSLGGAHGSSGGSQGGGQAEGGGGPQPAPGPASSSPSGKPTHRPVPSPSPSAVPSPTPGSSVSPSAVTSPSPSPSSSPTPCPSASASPSPSPSPSASPSPGPCPTPTTGPTPSPSPTAGPL